VVSPCEVLRFKSQKWTVTFWRCSRAAGAAVSGVAQLPQNLNPSGFCWPQLEHSITQPMLDTRRRRQRTPAAGTY